MFCCESESMMKKHNVSSFGNLFTAPLYCFGGAVEQCGAELPGAGKQLLLELLGLRCKT